MGKGEAEIVIGSLKERIRGFVTDHIIADDPNIEAPTAISAVIQEAQFVRDAMHLILGMGLVNPCEQERWLELFSDGQGKVVLLTRPWGRYSTDLTNENKVIHAEGIYWELKRNLLRKRRGYEDRLTLLMDDMARTEPFKEGEAI